MTARRAANMHQLIAAVKSVSQSMLPHSISLEPGEEQDQSPIAPDDVATRLQAWFDRRTMIHCATC